MSTKERLAKLVRSESPTHRVAVSFLSNFTKSAFGFLTAIIIARSLGPSGYGEYGFLITSFSSIAYLIDLGAANAFYSHISQRARGRAFYLTYTLWMGVQFLIASLLLLVLSPPDILKHLLLSSDRLTLFMAFCAVFSQQQIISALTMILESDRKTFKAQIVMLSTSIYLLAIVGIYAFWAPLNLRVAFSIMLSQQLLAAALLYKHAREIVIRSPEIQDGLGQCWAEYSKYCKPLIPATLFAFAYNYSDRWLLQKFSGSIEQGYFQIATQLSLITIIFTTSLLKVLAKESAFAQGTEDKERLSNIYKKAYRSSLLIASFITGIISPWTHEILEITLGIQYTGAANILILLLIYPIYQSLGQIAGTFLLSTKQTALHSAISISMIMISLPLGFFTLAPTSLHGLNLGAFGLALKMCLISFISVNILNYAVAKKNGFRLDFMSQSFILVFPGAGFLSKYIVSNLITADIHSLGVMATNISLTTILYLLLAHRIFLHLHKSGMAPFLPKSILSK